MVILRANPFDPVLQPSTSLETNGLRGGFKESTLPVSGGPAVGGGLGGGVQVGQIDLKPPSGQLAVRGSTGTSQGGGIGSV